MHETDHENHVARLVLDPNSRAMTGKPGYWSDFGPPSRWETSINHGPWKRLPGSWEEFSTLEELFEKFMSFDDIDEAFIVGDELYVKGDGPSISVVRIASDQGVPDGWYDSRFGK